MSPRRIAIAVGMFLLFVGSFAWADESALERARIPFREGAKLVEAAEWDSALAAFERSRAISEHSLTVYNIGVCQRFIGRQTLARETLRLALARAKEHPDEMPALYVEQAETYIREIEGRLARLQITLTPPDAKIAIEGRPLVAVSGVTGQFVAGIAPAGEARSLGLAKLEVLVDPRPGTVVTFSLDGYDTIEVKRDLKPGAREDVTVSMSEQPAQMRIAANVKEAIVRVDGVDVGMAPVAITRPPGPRLVTVIREGYVPYEAKLTLKPGQDVPIDARLAVEGVPITKKWWFWAGAAVIVAGVGIGTYFLVRPEPERPDPQRGGLGWLVEAN